MKVKEERGKVCLKLKIQKIKIMASSPITSWEIDGETMETVRDFILGAPKSLQMMTAAMKLKVTYSLEESYNQPRQHKTFAHKGPSSQGYCFPIVMCGYESWTVKKAEHQELMLLNCGVKEDS